MKMIYAHVGFAKKERKPRIKKLMEGFWGCSENGVSSFVGTSPKAAYENWKQFNRSTTKEK